jgi:hypothetical protein
MGADQKPTFLPQRIQRNTEENQGRGSMEVPDYDLLSPRETCSASYWSTSVVALVSGAADPSPSHKTKDSS